MKTLRNNTPGNGLQEEAIMAKGGETLAAIAAVIAAAINAPSEMVAWRQQWVPFVEFQHVGNCPRLRAATTAFKALLDARAGLHDPRARLAE